MVEHGLSEVSPGSSVVRSVENFPAGHNPGGVAEESSHGVAKGGFVRPTKGGLHSNHSCTPGQDVHGILVLFAMEDGNLLLVDLEDWSIGAGDDIVGRDLLSGGGSGGGGRVVAVAG